MSVEVLLKANTSAPDWKFPVIETVALASVVLSGSVKVIPLSIATGVEVVSAPSVNAVIPRLSSQLARR